MATLADVRRLALALPATVEGTTRGNVAWRVRARLFVWERPLGPTDTARLAGEGAPLPEGPLVAAHVPDAGVKAALIADRPDVYLAIEHLANHDIVLARLDAIVYDELSELVEDAWLCRAPARLAAEHLRGRP